MIVPRLLGVPLVVKILVANAAILTLAVTAVAVLTARGESIALTATMATVASLAFNAFLVHSALAPLRELERVAVGVERGDRGVRARPGLVRDPQTERISALANRILDAHEAQRRELEAAAERLARLTAREVQSREEERRLVAGELREQVGQSCAAIRVGLQALVNALDRGDADQATVRSRVAALIGLARDTQDVVQERSQGLRPSALDDLGLVPALRSAAGRWSSEYGLPVRFSAEGAPPRIASSLGIALYRVAEEAVANAARHARATGVDLSVRTEAEQIELVVADDGGGFDPERLDPARLGLLAMRERVGALGGRIELRSSAGRGTRLVARAPLRGPEGAPPTG